MRFRDLVFREHDHVSPPFMTCNYCGNSGCTLSAEIPLPNGNTALVVLCSRGCESAFKRGGEKADEWLADFLAKAEAYRADGADEKWPEEVDV